MSEPLINKLDDETWSIENNGVRFFLLKGKEKALLIDSGMNVPYVKALAEKICNLPVKLLNTHADIDHIGGNDEFSSFMMHPSEAINYYKIQKKVGIIEPIYDGDIIDLGERELEVMLTPGHTPGSIMLLDKSKGVIFSGDTVQDGNIFLFGPMRDIHAYVLGLKRISKWKGQYDVLYPSHGSLPVAPSLIDKLIDGATRVIKHGTDAKEAYILDQKVLVHDIGCAKIITEVKDE